MRLLGLDPGLVTTGWGVIDTDGNRLRHVANGTVQPPPDAPMSERLRLLYEGIVAVIGEHGPAEAAIEETFVNRNPDSTLKLGLARGAVMLAPSVAGLPVHEYAARLVKKAVVGTGTADKRQVGAMIAVLLPGAAVAGPDAADALAVAVCHSHHAVTRARWTEAAR